MTETKVGIYKTRTGNHGETLVHVPKTPHTHFWCYVNDESGEIRLVPAK